jgi:hypothetical protein
MTTLVPTSYNTATDILGVQPIAASFTVQAEPIGRKIHAYDPNFGEGGFVYAPGCAGTVVGSVVTIVTQDSGNGSTTLGNAQHGLLGVAMSANGAGSFGWYQVYGFNPNVLATGTAAAGDPAFIDTATPGTITSTSGTATVGFTIVTALSAGGVAGCQLNYPSC